MFSTGSLALSAPSWIADYIVWWVAALIVLVGLIGFGWNDVRRLRFGRVWAISSVSFAESLRRKVLWVTPLAILGALAVGQLQHTLDEQETIRQTIKFCLFASGILVTITAIILASTNLPREIESRVIFTIVTKPTTRLEIVLGKVLGFARVSGLIILIMGLFTFVYLELRTFRLNGEIAERLKTLKLESDQSSRHTLEGYQSAGLLSTKSLEQSMSLQVFDRVPTEGRAAWVAGGRGYFFIVPFQLDAAQRQLLEAATEDPSAGVLVINTMRLKRNVPSKTELEWIHERQLPMEETLLGPGIEQQAKAIPQLSVKPVNEDLRALGPSADINGGKPTTINLNKVSPEGLYSISTALPASVLRPMIDARQFFIRVEPETPSVDYEVGQMPTVIVVEQAGGKETRIDPPLQAGANTPAPPQFLSNTNRYGMSVEGNANGEGSVGVYQFRHVSTPSDPNRLVSFRFRAGVEHGGDIDPSQAWSLVSLEVVNRQTHESSGQIEFHPETNRDFPVPVQAKFVAGGDFDVYVRGKDNGQFIGLTRNSVQFISAEHSFVLNLFKSLLILWLLSILVVIIGIFTSTFLSWPIAIVLTLVILLGHWGVEQLGDALSPGVGRSVATDLGFQEAAEAKVVSSSIEGLAKLLRGVSAVLPDLSQFPVMDDITRGVSIPARHLVNALGVLFCYGLPMLVLSFIILKNKEVAP